MSDSFLDNCYGTAQLPSSAEKLRDRFRELVIEASDRIADERLKPKQPRTRLDRDEILKKTGCRCHICGGEIAKGSYWEADHVFPAAAGGSSDIQNYLPAHGLCNTAKWHRSGEDLQWILKVGVWARKQMEGDSELGQDMLRQFYQREQQRVKRQKASRKPAAEILV